MAEISVVSTPEEGAFYVSSDKNALLEFSEFLTQLFPDGEQEPVKWDKAAKRNVLKVDVALKPPKSDLEALLQIFTLQGNKF